jgi:uncharacterized protein involved in outer membrane biogenesis
MKPPSRIGRFARILTLAVAVFIICLLLAAVVFVTVFDDDDYQRLAEWSVRQFTGYRMIVEGPFTVVWSVEPVLSAARIRFESAADGPKPPLTAIGQFHVKVALKPLLLGRIVIKKLRVDDVAVWIDDLGAGEDAGLQRRKSPPDIIIPIFESVVLQNIQVTVVDPDRNRKINVLLRQLTMDDIKDTGPLFVKGEGSVNAHDFQIEGRLGALADIFKKRQPYPVELELKIVDFRLTLSGTVDHLLEGKGLNLRISADEQELSNLFDILQLKVPDVGHLKFAATLSGDAAAPTISGLNLDISDGTSVKLSARGSITNLISGTGTYISIDEESTNKDLFKFMFPDSWKVVEEFRFKGTLGNIEGDYTLEDSEASVVNDKGVTLRAAGWLRFGDFIDGNILKAVDVKLNLASPHTDTLRPLLTDEIPEVGSVTAEGRLTGPVERLALEDLVIRRGGSGPVQMVTKGRIGWIPLEDDQPIADMDLDVSIQSEQSTILSAFYGVPIDEIGSLSLTGRVTGSTDRFQISDLKMLTIDAHGLKTVLSGGIDFAEQETGEILGNVNCKLRIDAPSMKAAEPLIRATLFPALGPVSAETLVTGTTEVLALEKIAIIAGQPERIQIKWNGRVGKFPLTDDQPFSDVETVASLQAVDASALAELFGISLPDIGPVQGSWRTTDRDEIIGLEDVEIVVGDGEKFRLKATGAIDSVVRHDEIAIDGIDLQIQMQAADTHLVSKLLEIPLPDIGSVEGRLTVSGGQEALAISDIDLMSRSPDGVKISATGAVGHIVLGKETTIREVGVQLTASAPDVSAVPLLTDWSLPELGPFQLSARLKDRENGLDVENFEIRTGTAEKTTIRINGRLNHLQSPKHEKMDLQADFEALSRPWLQTYLKQSPAESPQFTGSLRLAIGDNPVRIDTFKISTAELGGLSLQAGGTVDISAQKPEIDVHIISAAGSPSAWGPVLGVALPSAGPLYLDGRYSRRADKHIFQGDTRIGNTQLQTNFRGAFDRQQPRMDVSISAPIVYLKDLGASPVADTQSSAPAVASRKKNEPPLPLFDDNRLPLDFLRDFDLSLNLNADKVVGKNVALNQVGLDVILENGRLQIGPSSSKYREGFVSIEAALDASSDKVPEMAVKVTAEDMDIDDVLSYLHEPLIVEGQLNLVVDLRSKGRSIRQIASGLTGELGLALENGRIQRTINLLAADALDFLFTVPAKNTYTDLNCMVVRLQLEYGNGAIEVLYLDTPAVRVRGAGSVNLADGTLDVVINPTAKKRLFKSSSPVRIQGQLGNPSVKKVPVKEAAILAGQIFAPFVTLPVRALGYLWSLVRNDKDENSPCIRNAPDKSQESVEK